MLMYTRLHIASLIFSAWELFIISQFIVTRNSKFAEIAVDRTRDNSFQNAYDNNAVAPKVWP